ncbi:MULTISPECIES: DUF1835 domain-containing protein [unclassified Caballeronia]|uniref:DUF1835 domain-containing protein n=1 Tax=unclassified Caballeronia TaxID=2646786 RepID=UPI002866CD9B|nr:MULTISPECIES: DUF1835 domain-containing protein [unclassified Caballeronia]MDR5739910.1 DUF1835 domain-containing protein [Caballeronia sp. LZ016]MDR5808376.1 DUF1835 domain-containing protein [Caballeronia sp. LZ019]
MKPIHHLCQGGSAAAMLRASLREPVIEILDDGSIGPLADVDTDAPDARVAFMKALFACGGFDHEDEAKMDWYGELRDMNRRFGQLVRDASEVVIWAEHADAEQALRRRAHWWLRDAAVTVSEIDVSLRDIARSIPKGQALALDIDQAASLVSARTPCTPAMRAQLANDWAALKQDGDAVRVCESGRLVSYPIDRYDAEFAALASTAPVKLLSGELLGAAMHRSGRSDLFCKWRFAQLIAQQKLAVTQGDLRNLDSVWVAAN